ncbi:hypothetical protein FHR24_002243 [Wenyingzhuangia heitensis]|uniref:TOD1/MUCI70 glycosyltransferase-like domain-containing protein n=1 Tax=Wenyingzhuangia heitensis TaxID=1487859 RepID=A0ABX0UAC6_9FLAO|nr:glycosyltransferase domain-containing protein [Wenyingzhuangia heitensis]NIJ45772.1 hypothetical protein [Wenyingzhuangia heitensis]
MKTVIYTAIFGKKIGLFKQPAFKNVKYVCYTDQDISSKHWEVRKVEPWFDDPTRNNRYVKILPHLFFKEYDLSIYLDVNYLITGNVPSLLKKVYKDNTFMCFNHNKITGDARNCIYKELEHILYLGELRGEFKDDPKLMKAQLENYKSEGYPKDNGMIRGSVLIRNHNNTKVIEFMNEWWQQLTSWSRRDQLSCNYAAWKTNFTINYLPGNGVKRNDWFLNLGSNRTNFSRKLFKVKLKKLLKGTY